MMTWAALNAVGNRLESAIAHFFKTRSHTGSNRDRILVQKIATTGL
ncbi:MAG: hypothetical protein HC800_01855 [Phormidesmis sp. RL_2_1]|nr:hypothetical protein [Phormidesmis sp. RL_2_1]